MNLRRNQNLNTVDSLYLELARDQKICSRQREFEIEREKQVTSYTKGSIHQFDIERGSRQRVFEIERVNCIQDFMVIQIYGMYTISTNLQYRKIKEVSDIVTKSEIQKSDYHGQSVLYLTYLTQFAFVTLNSMVEVIIYMIFDICQIIAWLGKQLQSVQTYKQTN